MCNSSSSVLVLNRTSPSLLHTFLTFVAYTTQLSIAIAIAVQPTHPALTPSGVFLFSKVLHLASV